MTIYSFFSKHPLITFFLLIISGLAFGAMTLNIFSLVAANWTLISHHGFDALRDGAFKQAIELIFTGMISMIFYIIFKFSERTLIEWFSNIRLRRK